MVTKIEPLNPSSWWLLAGDSPNLGAGKRGLLGGIKLEVRKLRPGFAARNRELRGLFDDFHQAAPHQCGERAVRHSK